MVYVYGYPICRILHNTGPSPNMTPPLPTPARPLSEPVHPKQSIGYEEKEFWSTVNYYELNQRLGTPFDATTVSRKLQIIPRLSTKIRYFDDVMF